jgi:hypothetical protein
MESGRVSNVGEDIRLANVRDLLIGARFALDPWEGVLS